MTTLTVRPLVRWFSEQMELKLRENEHKGGWHQDAPHKLMARVCDEVAECVDALKPGDAAVDTFRFAAHCLRSAGAALRQFGPYLPVAADGQRFAAEAADVANMALMVADHFRAGGPSGDQGKTLAQESSVAAAPTSMERLKAIILKWSLSPRLETHRVLDELSELVPGWVIPKPAAPGSVCHHVRDGVRCSAIATRRSNVFGQHYCEEHGAHHPPIVVAPASPELKGDSWPVAVAKVAAALPTEESPELDRLIAERTGWRETRPLTRRASPECPECDGTGKIVGSATCGACDGTGKASPEQRCYKCNRPAGNGVSLINDGEDGMGPIVCCDCYSPERGAGIDPRPRCIRCGKRWVPAEGVDATITLCGICLRDGAACSIHPAWSGVCEFGTRGCNLAHETSPDRGTGGVAPQPDHVYPLPWLVSEDYDDIVLDADDSKVSECMTPMLAAFIVAVANATSVAGIKKST